MYHRIPCIVAAFALLMICAPDLPAQGKDIKPLHTFNGRIDNDTAKKAPANPIVDEKVLTKLWKDWKVNKDMPKIDFAKEMALTATSGSSGMGISARLDKNGDLTTVVIATADIRPDSAFQIIVISREGVKSFNGKELPKPAEKEKEKK